MGATMRHVFLTTVGTSSITNLAKGDPTEGQNLLRNANKTAHDLDHDTRQRVDALAARARDLLADADDDTLRRFSAELNGQVTYERHAGPSIKSAPHHILICTDTYQSEAAGGILNDWLSGRGHSVDLRVIPNLVANELVYFRDGLTSLARICAEELPDYREAGYWVVFNLNGSFKAVQGFLQSLGNIFADETIYVFQSGDELLRVPRLPVRLDLDDVIKRHHDVFRKLYAGYLLPASDGANIPETLLMEIDGTVTLSEWGTALYGARRSELNGDALLPPLNGFLQFSKAFKQTVDSLPPDRMRILNRRMEDLALCLDPEFGQNPDSLSFKTLKTATAVPGSTHECYAWSDRDAGRVFGHFEAKVFVVDKLGAHL